MGKDDGRLHSLFVRKCGALFYGAEVEMGTDSEETYFPSPDTSGTLGVSELPHWVSASGRRVASFLFPGAIFTALDHRRKVRAWGICHSPPLTARTGR